MNDRIENIARSIGIHRDKFGMYFADNNHNEEGVDLEKFSEMIIRECAIALYQHAIADQKAGFGHEAKVMTLAGDLIKKHFGVRDNDENS